MSYDIVLTERDRDTNGGVYAYRLTVRSSSTGDRAITLHSDGHGMIEEAHDAPDRGYVLRIEHQGEPSTAVLHLYNGDTLEVDADTARVLGEVAPVSRIESISQARARARRGSRDERSVA